MTRSKGLTSFPKGSKDLPEVADDPRSAILIKIHNKSTILTAILDIIALGCVQTGKRKDIQ